MATVAGVVVFPGTNCEHDVAEAVERAGASARLVWHEERHPGPVDVLVLAGGFAHGDYLRPGALARFSPIMDAVREHAATGGTVLGICNGFQVLCEAGMLPGALQKNRGLRFLCTTVDVVVASDRSALTRDIARGTTLRLPINHFSGNYTCNASTLATLVDQDRVILRYRDNPNGSLDAIAGICDGEGNVTGIMPHPERAADAMTGGTDGLVLLRSILACTSQAAARTG